GAMNPCPCGYYEDERCRCTNYEILKYRQRLSGPILDRLDIQKYVGPTDIFEPNRKEKCSKEIREAVENARKRQQIRYRNIPSINSNSEISPKLIDQFCQLDQECTSLLRQVQRKFRLSASTTHKYIKIARTIA